MTGVERPRAGGLSPQQLGRLLTVGRSLVSELDLEAVLRHVLDAARELTGARYAALGILDAEKRELERFVFVGIDEATRERIGPLPRGHGLLGELIREPRMLRLERLNDHPRSYGFPAEHPPMTSFLGGPVKVRGEVYGNLYLTDKDGGDPFTDEDEQLLEILAEWAAIAIANARSHSVLESRRHDLERVVRGLEAITGLTRELEREVDADRALELVVKRGRALVDASASAVLLVEDRMLTVSAVAGELPPDLVGTRIEAPQLLEMARAPTAQLLQGPALAATVGERLAAGSRSALVAPLRSRGQVLGAYIAMGSVGRDPFEHDDELMLGPFAATAAGALAAIEALADERTRQRVNASEQERQRWARELHDETLQELGALKLAQQSALNVDDAAAAQSSIETSLERIDWIIEGLQGLITELRPAALDQLGTQAAVETLIDRLGDRHDLEITADFDLAWEQGREPTRHTAELEATIYRLVQEALTNVAKHAGATTARVALEESDGEVVVTVEDDGSGPPEADTREGFGLLGMRERAELLDGEFEIGPGPTGGTRVRARLPVDRRAAGE
jgi:signal transduction histidine kinase